MTVCEYVCWGASVPASRRLSLHLSDRRTGGEHASLQRAARPAVAPYRRGCGAPGGRALPLHAYFRQRDGVSGRDGSPSRPFICIAKPNRNALHSPPNACLTAGLGRALDPPEGGAPVGRALPSRMRRARRSRPTVADAARPAVAPYRYMHTSDKEMAFPVGTARRAVRLYASQSQIETPCTAPCIVEEPTSRKTKPAAFRPQVLFCGNRFTN